MHAPMGCFRKIQPSLKAPSIDPVPLEESHRPPLLPSSDGFPRLDRHAPSHVLYPGLSLGAFWGAMWHFDETQVPLRSATVAKGRGNTRLNPCRASITLLPLSPFLSLSHPPPFLPLFCLSQLARSMWSEGLPSPPRSWHRLSRRWGVTQRQRTPHACSTTCSQVRIYATALVTQSLDTMIQAYMPQ